MGSFQTYATLNLVSLIIIIIYFSLLIITLIRINPDSGIISEKLRLILIIIFGIIIILSLFSIYSPYLSLGYITNILIPDYCNLANTNRTSKKICIDGL